MKQSVFIVYIFFTSYFFLRCSSDHILLQPVLTGNEKTLGDVKGKACGFVGFPYPAFTLLPIHYFIPIRQTSKIERAYQNALEQIPGTKAIKNIKIEEFWFWGILGNFQCLTISGEAIQ
ncbi:hypothetical protein [Leptospira stimsonii]|uniref:Lipoprotein n=1 Tax=Leptospira stimsonii TaxID=2202203 RepID=A0ABY2NDX3_9LEPT|nr:hypothetical protein [Leptospira stimsonii]TGK14236.1 hypothetical protein EHO98_17790 [Leptospira stimsonii]TGM22089.1 hypothetical protein EHQ90_01260 [Leptospira stimsonii]